MTPDESRLVKLLASDDGRSTYGRLRDQFVALDGLIPVGDTFADRRLLYRRAVRSLHQAGYLDVPALKTRVELQPEDPVSFTAHGWSWVDSEQNQDVEAVAATGVRNGRVLLQIGSSEITLSPDEALEFAQDLVAKAHGANEQVLGNG
ncbi:MAG: hypothetical protein OXH52_16225 [Gammaproteobacteria bacterium]|nr:hypothetical protein [Gammaproteobacteria bacterium]